jgi:PKD repeat protein
VKHIIAAALLLLLPGCPCPDDCPCRDDGGTDGSPADGDADADADAEGPTAVAVADVSSGMAPLTVVFSGSESVPGDAPIASYSWDLGDGSAPRTGIETTAVYLSAGEVTAVLTVTDENGLSDTDSVVVTVAPEVCPTFLPDGVTTGIVASAEIVEASGLAVSRRHDGVLWLHNDGGQPRFFALTPEGTHLGIFNLVGASGRDWEDMAIGPGPEPGVDYLYFGDVGDNNANREGISIFRVQEPDIEAAGGDVGSVDLTDYVRLDLVYPDRAHNCETVLLDPVTTDLYLVTKENDGLTHVFRYPFPQDPGVVTTLVEVATLQFGSGDLPGATVTSAGDISPLGNQVAIRAYGQAYIWIRNGGASIAEALAGTPCPVPIEPEPIGEAIAFSADGLSYYTVSEGINQPIWHYVRQ